MSSAPDTSLPLASHLLSTPPSSSGTENGEMALAAHRVDAIEKHVEERLPDNHPTEVGDAEAQDKKSHAGRATTLAYKRVEEA